MTINQKITTNKNKYEIIASGQFLAFRESSIELWEGSDKIKLNFIFKEKDVDNKKVDGKKISNNEITLTFSGFDDSNLGSGTKEPFSIGRFMGKELLLSYRVNTLDDKTLRTFNYTFYVA